MKKYIPKILIIFMILLIILPTFCYGEVIIPEGQFEQYRGGGGSSEKLKPMINNIAGIIATIGSVVSVAALVIIGIRYMLGPVEERAEYKKTLIPYVVGALMVFAMTTIPTIIYNIVSVW